MFARYSSEASTVCRKFHCQGKRHILSRVYQFKYLGVVPVDPYLSWNDHIDYIGRKISARLGMLRKARKVVPRESCITLYNATILPLFDDSAATRDCCGKTNRDYLDKLQRRTCRQYYRRPQNSTIAGPPHLQVAVTSVRLIKMHASFQVYTWISTTLLT